jgi:hypothetical protein
MGNDGHYNGGRKNVTREHFVQVLNNLSGYSVQHCMIEDARSSRTDHRNQLDHMHNLEKKMFERSVEFFFDSRYGGYVLDDELISSIASDIEHKVVSDRKSGGEGPTCDCFCDSYAQLMLGMRVRSSRDMQLFNVEKLLNTLPTVAPNTASAFGLILACDHGYGKKSMVEMFTNATSKLLQLQIPLVWNIQFWAPLQ